jgi:hypothetical protein
MTPEVSRAVATVKFVMELSPGPVLDELLAAGDDARTVDDLPSWARAVLNAQNQPDPTDDDPADRLVGDLGDGTITPPPEGLTTWPT